MNKRSKHRNELGKEQRMVLVETLQKLMDHDKDIIAFEADLGDASGFAKIQKSHPKQFMQCGIAEANMTGVAAGMSLLGFKPFIHSFAPFVSRRNFDQLYISGAYAENTINIYGSDPGFCSAHNGGTHTTWEDIALMRMIPHSIIIDPCDAVQMAWTIEEFAKLQGIHYVRSNRKSVRKVYDENATFAIGCGNIVKEGKDVLIIAAGELVSEALDAAEILDALGVQTEVIDMFCIKPIDEKLIITEAKMKKLIVSFENHSIYGGLGSAIEEVLLENEIYIHFKKIGVKERFGQVGTASFLQKEYGLNKEHLIEEIMRYMSS